MVLIIQNEIKYWDISHLSRKLHKRLSVWTNWCTQSICCNVGFHENYTQQFLCNRGVKLFICTTKVLRYLCIFHNYRHHYFVFSFLYFWFCSFFFVVSGFELGGEVCEKAKCNSRCKNHGDHCNLLWNCSSVNYNCCMNCEGKGCKQTCNTGVEVCEMNLECKGDDCDQTCMAYTCKLNCSGKNCKNRGALKKADLHVKWI